MTRMCTKCEFWCISSRKCCGRLVQSGSDLSPTTNESENAIVVSCVRLTAGSCFMAK